MRRLLFCNPATYTASDNYLKRQHCVLAAANAWCVPRALDRCDRRDSRGGGTVRRSAGGYTQRCTNTGDGQILNVIYEQTFSENEDALS